jgi:hypothetical protein
MGLKRDSIGEWGAKTHGYANRLKEQQKKLNDNDYFENHLAA